MESLPERRPGLGLLSRRPVGGRLGLRRRMVRARAPNLLVVASGTPSLAARSPRPVPRITRWPCRTARSDLRGHSAGFEGAWVCIFYRALAWAPCGLTQPSPACLHSPVPNPLFSLFHDWPAHPLDCRGAGHGPEPPSGSSPTPPPQITVPAQKPQNTGCPILFAHSARKGGETTTLHPRGPGRKHGIPHRNQPPPHAQRCFSALSPAWLSAHS